MKVRKYIMSVVNRLIKRVSPSAKEELEVMEQWKNEYLNEMNSIDRIQKNTGLSEKYAKYKDYHPDVAWSRLQNDIKGAKKDNIFNGVKIPEIYRWAAIFIFVALSFWAVQSSLFTSLEPVQFVAKSEKLEFTLGDHSGIVLDTASVLVQSGFRKVELQGRALFDISKDPENIFEIETSNARIQVLGTSFLVTTRENYTDIFVIEGKVSVSSGNEKIVLEKDQSVIVENNSILHTSRLNGVFSDWKKNILTFDNVDLVEVLKTVSNHYNVTLVLPDKLPESKCTINTKFKEATLENVMQELSLIARIKFTFHNKTLIIDQIQC